MAQPFGTETTQVDLEVFLGDQVFTHTDDNGVQRTFYTSAMARIADKFGGRCDDILAACQPLLPEIAAHSRAQMGVEQARLDRLVAPWLDIPLISIIWPGTNFCTIVDGHHRLCKLHELGRKEYKSYVFKHPFWENFVADFIHPVGGESHIIEAEKRYGVRR